MSVQVITDSELKTHIDVLLASAFLSTGVQAWSHGLEAFLAKVVHAIPAQLHNPDFLLELWNLNPVSKTGSGSVIIEPALADAGFVDWFAGQVTQFLPQDSLQAEARLIEFYDELSRRLKMLCDRLPRLKINRVLCALYPDHFTTITDEGRLKVLHVKLGGNGKDHIVQMHRSIRARTDRVLDEVGASTAVTRITHLCIPWLLFERLDNNGAGANADAFDVSEQGLSPQPASLRRKGLTSLGGGFQTLLGLLPEISEGVTRQEFIDLLRQNNPSLAENSAGSMINVVAREFDLCRREGDGYVLSARGNNLLDTQDPDELADHLLTRVLGTDHVIKALESDDLRKSELITLLQLANPGWTSSFAPSSMIGWLIYLDVITDAAGKRLKLTERGRRWAQMITWAPQNLPQPKLEPAERESTQPGAVELPSSQQLHARIERSCAGRLAFDSSLIGQLHAGLWCHPVRHFAVLTGISGSGKTQLAVNYAQGLCDVQQHDTQRVRVIPVQPGWYDPSPLLGYVNPIQEASYRSTPFLDLLLQAADNPELPFVAILDEMNLSHPEQYMAPVLSAMETHGWIDLHQSGEGLNGVPGRVRYPANLAIIGTLNMDETTHGLSDKVLDRAFTLEFWKIDVEKFPGWSTSTLPGELRDTARSLLGKLVEALEPARLHFGWRTIDDVLSYLTFLQANDVAHTQALDDVLYAKVLPKLRGEHSPRFVHALDRVQQALQAHGLERCLIKVKALQDDLIATGSARFWR